MSLYNKNVFEERLICKKCSIDFGSSQNYANIRTYIRHLHETEHECTHNILSDLSRFDLPDICPFGHDHSKDGNQ